MNNLRAQQRLTDWLLEQLDGMEFAPSADNEYLVRHMPSGQQYIGMIIRDLSSVMVELSLLVAVRLDAVEEIYHRFSGASPEHRSYSKTVVTPLNYFIGGQESTRITSDAELESTLKSWEQRLISELLPYLRTAVDVVSLDHCVNITHDVMDITNPPASYVHHIILAKLAGNPGLADIAALHRHILTSLGCDTDVYDAVLGYLSRH